MRQASLRVIKESIIKKFMKAKTLTKDEIKHIARLAHLILTDKQLEWLVPQLSTVISYVSHVETLDTKGVVETSQVTGTENVFRDDVIDASRLLTQEETLSNAKKTHNGFFLVKAVL